MPIRTTRTHVTFNAPFTLPELDGVQPAGSYDVETDEEAFEGNGRTVYVRVATLLRVCSAGLARTVTINPAGLQAALERDAAATTIPDETRAADRKSGG